MEQIIQSRIDKTKSREENVHQVREFLQLLILKIINELNYFQYISFVGGTCLRFLHKLQRFSEDLDFSLIQEKGYDFQHLIQAIEFNLKKIGFNIEIKLKDQKTVQNAYFKFIDLLQQYEISQAKDQRLSIRLGIDSNPPSGWKTEMSVINDFYIFPVWHFDLPSLFATKIHACLFRKFRKGRDYYDLVWYLSKKVSPNFGLLANAIKQTEHEDIQISHENFKNFLKKNMEELDYQHLRNDVAPFLINKSEVNLIDRDIIFKLVDDYYATFKFHKISQ